MHTLKRLPQNRVDNFDFRLAKQAFVQLLHLRVRRSPADSGDQFLTHSLKIRIPSEYLGDVMSDISGKRGSVHGVDPDGDMSTIDAEAPLSEVQRYATDLRALSGGRGRFTIEFDRYVEVPAHVQEEILKQLEIAESN